MILSSIKVGGLSASKGVRNGEGDKRKALSSLPWKGIFPAQPRGKVIVRKKERVECGQAFFLIEAASRGRLSRGNKGGTYQEKARKILETKTRN